ncbi:MAG: hypothetical protein ACFB6R_04400 [Alphaproteobacteria bacterium]
MLTEFLSTLLGILEEVFLPNDVFRAVCAVVVAVVAGMILKEFKLGKVVNLILICLVIFGALLAARDFATNYNPSFNSFVPWIDSNLNKVLNLRVGVLLVYFIAFGIVIAAAFSGRRLLK